MFKSIESYSFSNNTTGITISGSGIISIKENTDNAYAYNYVVIDGISMPGLKQDALFLFADSVKVYNGSSGSGNTIEVTIGIFN